MLVVIGGIFMNSNKPNKVFFMAKMCIKGIKLYFFNLGMQLRSPMHKCTSKLDPMGVLKAQTLK